MSGKWVSVARGDLSVEMGGTVTPCGSEDNRGGRYNTVEDGLTRLSEVKVGATWGSRSSASCTS